MNEAPTRIHDLEMSKNNAIGSQAAKHERQTAADKRLFAAGKKQWEKWQAETTPQERERIKEDLAKESARIRAIPPETIAENIRAFQRAQQEEEERKQAYIAGTARFDPYAGEILLPGERPLHKTAIYHLTGKDGPRRFRPPVGSDKPGEETNVWHMVPDSGYRGNESQENQKQEERLIKRLLKAGWIEAELTAQDWAHVAHSTEPGIILPADIIREWLELQRKMQTETQVDRAEQPKKDWTEELCEMYEATIRALINEQIEEDERKAEAAKASYAESPHT